MKMNLLDVMSMLGRERSKKTVMDLIHENGERCDTILQYASHFRDDIDVVRAALSYDVRSIYYASERLRNDEELMIEVVQKSGRALQYVSEIRMNRRIVLAAVRQDGMAIQYAFQELWNDEEIVSEAIEQNPDVIDWINSLKNE